MSEFTIGELIDAAFRVRAARKDLNLISETMPDTPAYRWAEQEYKTALRELCNIAENFE